MKLRWGVIGACGIAQRRTIPEGIAQADNSELCAVMDLQTDRLKELAKKYPGVRVYENEAALLEDKNVDVVYIGIPTYQHCEAVVRAARAGKHVFCEKPMAMNLKECDTMIEECRRNRVKLSFGFMMRYHAAHQAILDMIRKKELGQIVMGRAELTCWYPDIPGVWRQDIRKAGGGALIDMGTHCLDLLEMFLGKIREVCGFRNTLTHKYAPVEDTATFLLRFESGAHGIVDNYFNVPDAAAQNVLEIYGTRGIVLCKGTVGQDSYGKMTSCIQRENVGYDAQQARVPEASIVEHKLVPVNIYKSEIESFARCISGNTDPDITPEQARRNIEVTLACYEAADTGKTIVMA